MSRRKSLPGARWRPDIATFDLDLAYRYEYGQLDELDTAIYATIKELSTKRPRAEIVEVRAEAFQMTQVDIVMKADWDKLSKEEQKAFALDWARTNLNKAMRIDDGLRVGMWQMKGDEAHVSMKIGGAHYSLDEQRDSEGRYRSRLSSDEPDEPEVEPDFERYSSEETQPLISQNEDADDVPEIMSTKPLFEVEAIERRENAEHDGRVDVLMSQSGSFLHPAETRADIAPGLSDNPVADDDDKDDPFHSEGGHLSYRPDWTKCHEEEARVITKLDIELHPESDEAKSLLEQDEAETEYETLVRILGTDDADWLWGYEWNKTGSNQRTRSASSSKDRSRAYRLRQKVVAAAEAVRPATGQVVPSEVSVTTRALSERGHTILFWAA